jgi:heptosyltransferase-2
LLLPNSFDAAWVAWRAGIPERWGYARDGRSPLLTRAVPRPRAGQIPPHQAYYYLELLRRLELMAALPAVESFVLRRPAGARERAREKWSALGVATGGPVVGLNPGAAFGTAKRWFPSRYVELGKRLRQECGAGVVLFGAAPERALVEDIAAAIGGGAVSTAGKTTLVDFLALVDGCDLFVTNDTGTMHVAAAAGAPVLALFGSTDERATAPLGPRVRLLKQPPECSPCLLRHCPVDHRCMRSLSVQEVFEAACQMLASVRPSSSIVTAP